MTEQNDKLRVSVNLDGEGNGSILATEGGDSLFLTTDGDPEDFANALDAINKKKSFSEIKACLKEGGLIALTALSDRVSISQNGTIFFDGEQVHSTVADAIGRYHREGRPYEGLVRFMERLSGNTSQRSRDELYKWLLQAGLKITEDGLVIGYKSVSDNFKSIHSGSARVNGELVQGNIPNNPGSVISMPREKVDENPDRDCSYGLHVGTLEFAKSFAGNVKLVVLVDPRDVVAVPDYNTKKMRVCQYSVIGEWDASKSHEPNGVGAKELTFSGVRGTIPTSFLNRLRERLTKR